MATAALAACLAASAACSPDEESSPEVAAAAGPASLRIYGVDGRLVRTLVAGEMKAWVDIGSHHIQALAFLGVLSGWWHSLYRLGSMKYEGVAVYTNKAPTGAIRGFGVTPGTYACEIQMNMIAERLGLDPWDLRFINAMRNGDQLATRTRLEGAWISRFLEERRRLRS